MIRRPPRSTHCISSAASDVYKRQLFACFALRFKDWFERLVLLWVGVASIPFLVLDSYNQTRIVYDLPVPILMAAALVFFLPLIGNRIVRWPGIIILLILVVCAIYALQGILLL